MYIGYICTCELCVCRAFEWYSDLLLNIDAKVRQSRKNLLHELISFVPHFVQVTKRPTLTRLNNGDTSNPVTQSLYCCLVYYSYRG